MEYIYKDHKVIIRAGIRYGAMEVKELLNLKPIYGSYFLALKQGRKACEENAQRIADQFIDHITEV